MKRTLIRPLVDRLHPYVPGEQPRISGLIKLNTNENPYPPAPAVLRAIRAAVDERLRLYPNPTSQPLREALAKLHGCKAENIIVGNGSDELLALAVRAFVEPAPSRGADDQYIVQYFSPSYSLYPVLAESHGALILPVSLDPDFGIPSLAVLKNRGWRQDAALTMVTTPNAPSGRGYTTAELDRLCRHQRGVVILDEAYVDFAEESSLALGLKHPHVLVARTFSKAYSLCFQRVGYFVGPAPLIAALDKVRDSYNVNGLGQVGALATLEHRNYYVKNFERIKQTRAWLSAQLTELGFLVLPSQANFILVKPPAFAASEWLERLKQKKILVRWFKYPEVSNYLRITIGTRDEAKALVKAARGIVSGQR